VALERQIEEMTIALSAKTRAHDAEHHRAERYARKLAELEQPDPVDADKLKRFLVFGVTSRAGRRRHGSTWTRPARRSSGGRTRT
jgi:hypothetical protein